MKNDAIENGDFIIRIRPTVDDEEWTGEIPSFHKATIL
jgi:hypothetical protein